MAERSFHLQIPLDASQIPGFKPERKVKVVARDGKGTLHSQVVELDARGYGVASFSFAAKPGELQVALGPEDIADDQMHGLRTLTTGVLARDWQAGPELKIKPVQISPSFWDWWWRLCRRFTITGQVLCADGRPAAGAKVCAYDVDYWWWWWSRDQVGCNLTDANGFFKIEFTWCCGFLPWWWWARRYWRLEPRLVERILPALQREGKLRVPVPTPRAELSLFAEMAASEPGSLRPPLAVGGSQVQRVTATAHPLSDIKLQSGIESLAIGKPATAIDSAVLGKLRENLLPRLPAVAALEPLRLWPWWPWEPWFDCEPDILFRVTQGPQNTVILDEGPWDVRWDIPTNLNVTLRANDKTICLAKVPPQLEGACVVVSNVCSYDVEQIGGNVGAPPATPAQAGYLHPGVSDNPFAEEVVIAGIFGNIAGVHYYEFEWSTGGGAMQPMPDGAVGGFYRRFYGPSLTDPTDPDPWHYVSFPVLTMSGHQVIESREHFEATHAPGTWGEGNQRQWAEDNYFVLIPWLTDGHFADGTYSLQLVGWKAGAGAGTLDLTSRSVLPLCRKDDAGHPSSTPNHLVLTLDNRVVVAGSGSTSNPSQICGTGTVHLCTQEPNTGFLGVTIIHSDGRPPTPVKVCKGFPINDTDVLQIDFVAEDPDGHLGSFTLDAIYDVNLVRHLIYPGQADLLHSVPGTTLTPAGMGLSIGPTQYGEALAQNVATSPLWSGGAYQFKILARQAFPETCCYQLELRAYKRTVVSCSSDHENLSTVSFMIEVSPG